MSTPHKPLKIWLSVICFLILVMVVIGGLTRLTHSGLSMVDWRPIMGVIPPISDQDWSETFEKYKSFPEYQQLNVGMTLAEFKSIFWWEYSHRLFGRLIGLALVLPWIYFTIRKKIPPGMHKKLAGLFALGALQGLLGWYMVQSGLVNNPYVSHYRLAAHLALAFFLLSATLWILFDISGVPRKADTPAILRKLGYGMTGLVSLQIIYGAFTAGLKAGYGMNTFPLMNGQLIPTHFIFVEPIWRTLLEGHFAVQFMHRTIGWILLFSTIAFWIYARRFDLNKAQKMGVHHLFGMVILQFILGVLTLVLVVPPHLAATHQVGAALTLAAVVFVNYTFARPKT